MTSQRAAPRPGKNRSRRNLASTARGGGGGSAHSAETEGALISRKTYALATLILFVIEVLIALFVRDAIIRPYVGDVLAVALVYTALRAITLLAMIPAIATALIIALVIEIAQALDLLGALGLRDNQLARIVLGGAFDWMDLIAYAVGGIVVVLVELAARRKDA